MKLKVPPPGIEPISQLASLAPQKSLFIRNVRLLKGLGKARGDEEEKENRKGKMKGTPEQKSGEMLSGIRDSV